MNLDASVNQTHLSWAKPDDNKSWAGSSDWFFSFRHIRRHLSLLWLSIVLRGTPFTERWNLIGGWVGAGMGKEEGGVYPPHFQYSLQLGSFLTALVRGKELASPFVLDMFFSHLKWKIWFLKLCRFSGGYNDVAGAVNVTCYIPGALGTEPRYHRGERGHIPNPFPKLLCAPCLSGQPLRRSREGISSSLLGREGIADWLNEALHVKGSIFYRGIKEEEKWQQRATAHTMVLERSWGT